MGKVTGIGGVFFKSNDPKKLTEWYARNLGMVPFGENMAMFQWLEKDDPERTGYTIWSAFAGDTTYFDPSTAPFMVNFRVDDLDSLLASLREAGLQVDDKIEESEYGRFGWVMDPDGNRIELWEPPEEAPAG